MDNAFRIFAVIGKWPENWEEVYGPVRDLMVSFRTEVSGRGEDLGDDDPGNTSKNNHSNNRPKGKTTHRKVAQSQPELCPCFNVGLSLPQGGTVSQGQS